MRTASIHFLPTRAACLQFKPPRMLPSQVSATLEIFPRPTELFWTMKRYIPLYYRGPGWQLCRQINSGYYKQYENCGNWERWVLYCYFWFLLLCLCLLHVLCVKVSDVCIYLKCCLLWLCRWVRWCHNKLDRAEPENWFKLKNDDLRLNLAKFNE